MTRNKRQERIERDSIGMLRRYGSIGQLTADLALQVLEEVNGRIDEAKRAIETLPQEPYFLVTFPDPHKMQIYAPERAIIGLEDTMQKVGIEVNRGQKITVKNIDKVGEIVQQCLQGIRLQLPISVASIMEPNIRRYTQNQFSGLMRPTYPIINGPGLETLVGIYTK